MDRSPSGTLSPSVPKRPTNLEVRKRGPKNDTLHLRNLPYRPFTYYNGDSFHKQPDETSTLVTPTTGSFPSLYSPTSSISSPSLTPLPATPTVFDTVFNQTPTVFDSDSPDENILPYVLPDEKLKHDVSLLLLAF